MVVAAPDIFPAKAATTNLNPSRTVRLDSIPSVKSKRVVATLSKAEAPIAAPLDESAEGVNSTCKSLETGTCKSPDSFAYSRVTSPF